MDSAINTAWLAGLLEGEGCFGFNRGCPSIQLQMSDVDVVERAAALLGIETLGKPWRPIGKPTYKIMHSCRVFGALAIVQMVKVRPYMGIRRGAKIDEILIAWQSSEYKPRGPKGTPRPPAPCHPERTLSAKGMCKPCYMAEYHRRAKALSLAAYQVASVLTLA